jgi:transposase
MVPFKVRRRVQAVRLAAQGWTAPRIARHLGLDRTTLHRDLRRWPERGIEGYALLEGRCGTGEVVAYLPRYSPHLNPVKTIWRRVKGFLMPRRHYRSVEELRGAVAVAMKRLREGLGQGVLHVSCPLREVLPPVLPGSHARNFDR